MIDCDVFLTNENTLNNLISKNLVITAPMLLSEGLYSNFWHGWTEDYYYMRTDGYKPILYREQVGCFQVPMVHSCVLIDLRTKESDRLTYQPEKLTEYSVPHDDIITLAVSANKSGMPMHICNDLNYGYITVPLEQDEPLQNDYQHLVNTKLEVLNEEGPLPVSPLLAGFTFKPEKDMLGFDKVFMINLLRRPERRKRMLACFEEVGLNVTVFDAVDGKYVWRVWVYFSLGTYFYTFCRNLSKSILQEIDFLPEYVDPYHKRPMTFGEIGCFLSHYYIWKEVNPS